MHAPRILIIRLSALGDIIHALPVLAALRERWPGGHIGWLVEPGGRGLLEGHPLISRLHVVPKKAMRENFMAAWRGPMRELRAELRSERYDIAIDIQGLTKSAAWSWAAGIPRRIGFRAPDAREAARFLNNERIAPGAGGDPRFGHGEVLHVVRRNLALLRPLGIDLRDAERIRFPVYLPEPARARAMEILGPDNPRTPLVVMSLGAGWATKIWPAERFGRLARALAEAGCRVALAWGPGEEGLVYVALSAAGQKAGEAAAKATAEDRMKETDLTDPTDPTDRIDQGEVLPDAPGVYRLPATTFVELGAVVARARLFIGGDTGPTHLAAALGVPTVSMMGPLDARRNGPFGVHCQTIQHAVPRPAPPWRNHRRWCDPVTDLRRVTVEEVWEACRRALGD